MSQKPLSKSAGRIVVGDGVVVFLTNWSLKLQISMLFDISWERWSTNRHARRNVTSVLDEFRMLGNFQWSLTCSYNYRNRTVHRDCVDARLSQEPSIGGNLRAAYLMMLQCLGTPDIALYNPHKRPPACHFVSQSMTLWITQLKQIQYYCSVAPSLHQWQLQLNRRISTSHCTNILMISTLFFPFL